MSAAPELDRGAVALAGRDVARQIGHAVIALRGGRTQHVESHLVNAQRALLGLLAAVENAPAAVGAEGER